LNDTLERAHIIELKRFLHNGAPVCVPVADAHDLAVPHWAGPAVVLHIGGLALGDAIGKFLFDFGTDNARPLREELHGRRLPWQSGDRIAGADRKPEDLAGARSPYFAVVKDVLRTVQLGLLGVDVR